MLLPLTGCRKVLGKTSDVLWAGLIKLSKNRTAKYLVRSIHALRHVLNIFFDQNKKIWNVHAMPDFDTRVSNGHYGFPQVFSVGGASWTLNPNKEVMNSKIKHTGK